MHQVSLVEATKDLRRLVHEAIEGEEVVITDGAQPVVKLVAVNGRTSKPGKRQFGSARGLVLVADDFDEPLEEFGEYM